MKKITIIVAVLFLSAISLNAQQAFNKGDKALNVGIGLGSSYAYLGYTALPAVNASFEVGMFEIPNAGVISVGAYADFQTSRNTVYNVTYGYTNISVAARAAFHFGFLNTEKFDVYAGVATGLRHQIDIYYDYNDNYLSTDVFAGGRIMFKKKFGAFAELGYGTSYLKAGLTFKF